MIEDLKNSQDQEMSILGQVIEIGVINSQMKRIESEIRGFGDDESKLSEEDKKKKKSIIRSTK